MRTLCLVLGLALVGIAPATALAAKGHKKHHARSHAKAKTKKSRTQHAAGDRLMQPRWS